MPIKDLSEVVRLPRLGKIHLGIKHPQKGYPMKTDYFVFPKDHSDYAKLVELFGEKPKELRILIPVEDEEQWATQYYKAYNQTYGLVCKGDGETALRMADAFTGELPQAKISSMVGLREIPCAGKDCDDYKAKRCHEVMNLKFLIPEVPGLGVWQIDTGSKNSILNINSCARIIKRAFGRISLIPLKLTLEPIQSNNPEDGKKQTVYVLNLRTEVTMAQLADQAREQAKMFLIETPDLGAVVDAQIEKDIEDLWGEEKPDLGKVGVRTSEIIEGEGTNQIQPEPNEDLIDKYVFSPTKDIEARIEGDKELQPETLSLSPLEREEPPLETGIDLDFDPAELLSELKEVKWKDETVKSYCKHIYKTDKNDNPLDIKLDIVPLIASLKRADRETFFGEIANRKTMR